MTRNRRPVSITDAEPSQDEQLRSRQVRYATMMGIRIVCLITAGILVSVRAPMLWLWLPLCIVGMVLLPWMAVLIANDRPPKREHTIGAKLRFGRRGRPPAAPAELDADRAPGRSSLAASPARTIEEGS